MGILPDAASPSEPSAVIYGWQLGMLRRTRLRSCSKKHAKELELYRRLRADYLATHPKCEVCSERTSTQIHHKAKRGRNLNRTETWAAVCRTCHEFVENHKSWARENGWLLPIQDC